ncbi:MAG: MCE family protein [candidate division Zixibacteria bacterium]|nr:MCE family protein [candidate division Zixibacteria bacterium]
MASGKNIEFRVGVIVLLTVAVLAVSLYWLQGYKLKYNSQLIMLRFDDVGTLAIGDKVTVSGVHKGKVNKLWLTDQGVLVELQVYQDVVLKRDAVFTIKNLGLMGERFIAISPGRDSLVYNLADTADGSYDYGIPEVMGAMGDMVAELRSLVRSLKRTVASDSSLDKFNRTVANLESVSASMAGYMNRTETKLDKTADNFLYSSRKLRDILTRNDDRIDSSFVRLDRVSQGLEGFVGQLDSLAQSARTFASSLENGEGTLQALMEDRRLYDDLRKAADNLDDLINDIRANPRKYINLKVELF